MRAVLIVMLGIVLLQGAGCTKDRSKGTAADAGGSKAGTDAGGAKPPAEAATTSPAAAKPEPPATLTDVNLVATDMGGAVEELTGFYGPGLRGRRLIDGLLDRTWRARRWLYHFTREADANAFITQMAQHFQQAGVK